jgi:hypothetical protein
MMRQPDAGGVLLSEKYHQLDSSKDHNISTAHPLDLGDQDRHNVCARVM